MKFHQHQLLTQGLLVLLLCCFGSRNLACGFRAPEDPELSQLFSKVVETKRISEMQQLIDTAHQISANFKHTNSSQANHLSASCGSWMGTDRKEDAVMQHIKAIIDLGPILSEREDVCKTSHIDMVEAYKEKHLDPGFKITKSFFNLYTNQVSFECKRNLWHALNVADSEYVDQDDYIRVMPWQTAETCFRDLEKDKDHLAEGYIKIARERCNAIMALTSTKGINELTEVLISIKSTALEGQNSRTNAPELFTLLIPEKIRPSIEEMRSACKRLELIYAKTILPIVRLLNMGFDPDYQKFNRKCKTEPLIQRWFSVTVICTSMMNSRLGPSAANHGAGLIVVGDDNLETAGSANETSSTESEGAALNLNEKKPLPKDLYMYPIEDELWIGKYQPSRLKKLTTRYVHNIMKAFKLDKLHTNVVFKRRINRVKGVIISLLLLQLTLLGINVS